MEQKRKEQIQKELNKNNASKVHDLNELFKRAESLLHKIEVHDCNIDVDEELINSLMDVIYRSAIKTFVTSIYNAFFKYNSMPLENYHEVEPLLERWRSVLGAGDNLNKQTLVDFVAELDEFAENQPHFVFNCNADNGTWTISKFFEQGIWVPYFKDAEDKAIALCCAIRKALESRGSNIELIIKTGYSLISPFEFEELIAALFSKLGYEAEVTAKTGDYGIDIIAKNEQDVIAIQTKKYAKGNNVGNRDVQRLLGAMQLRHVKANKSILITTSDFTVQALEQAKETPIELWDGNYISSLLLKHMNNH